MTFRTGTPQWMKLSQLSIREKARRLKEEQDIIKMQKLKKEIARKLPRKIFKTSLGYWENINGWRFIRW